MGNDDKGGGPRKWAELRFSIIGPLLACPPAQGELDATIKELARRHWLRPNGELTTFGASTIERWLYLAKGADDPIAALTRKVRSDAGCNRVMSELLLEALRLQYTAHPGWSYKLHSDNLDALVEEKTELGESPSYSTVRRRMKARGWRRRKIPRKATEGQRRALEKLETLEVRSFEAKLVHAVWHYDGHEAHRKVVLPDGTYCKPVALAVLDDRSRLCCHLQWYLSESAENLFHCLCQAYHKRGLPRAELHDNGSAMKAAESLDGAKRLGIIARPTLPYSPFQNGKQEKFWDVLEGRLMAMLERVEPLQLAFLNRASQAWVEQDYNHAVNDEMGVCPIDRMLEGPSASRRAPDTAELRFRFTRRRRRKQRHSDGTISVDGVRFELPSRLRFLDHVWVRYQSWDMSMAYVVDEKTDDLLARIWPLDKERNADGRRRALSPGDDPVRFLDDDQDTDPLPPLMRKYLADYAATGLPPAYLPKEEAINTTGLCPEEDDHE